jgi:hypothetical protein
MARRRPANQAPDNLVDLYRQFKEGAKCDDTAAALLVLASVIKDKTSLNNEGLKEALDDFRHGLEYTLESTAVRLDGGLDVVNRPPPSE